MTKPNKINKPNPQDKIVSQIIKRQLRETYDKLIKTIQDDSITFQDIEQVAKETLAQLSIECSKDLLDMMKTVRSEKAKKLEKKMTPQEIAFGMLFCHGEFMGNGTRCYEKAYNHPIINKIDFAACTSRGNYLLKLPRMALYLSELMSTYVLNEVGVDQQLKFLIMQGADLKAKLGAIREFNKLNNRIQDKLLVGIWHERQEQAQTEAQKIVEQYQKQRDEGEISEDDMGEVERFAGRVVDSRDMDEDGE